VNDPYLFAESGGRQKKKVSGTPGLFLLPRSRPSSVGGLCTEG
jgi:hypothetical protein